MVYHFGNDIKVNLCGLGVYPISTEIELPLSSNSVYSVLPPKLRDAESFTQPLAPLSPTHLPEFSSLSPICSSTNQTQYTKSRSVSSSSPYPSASKCSFAPSRKSNSSSCPHSSLSSSSTGGSSRSSMATSHPQTGSLSRHTLHSSSSASPCRMDKIDHGYLSEGKVCRHRQDHYHDHNHHQLLAE